jgi:hypothetical protein
MRSVIVRRCCLLALVVTLTVISSGCGLTTAPPPNLTPAAQTAFHSQQAQNVLDQIRDIAQDASKTVPPVVSRASAIKITDWHRAAITIVHEAGSGWPTAVVASLTEVLKSLSPAEQALLAPYVTLTKTILTEVAK